MKQLIKRLLSTLAAKWPEYIFEILVVTIGILGAFALNNWQEDRSRAALEKQLLAQIASDIEDNLEDVSSDAHLMELSQRSYLTINKYIQEDRPYNDTLCFDFYWLIHDEFTTPSTAGFDNLQDVGIDLVSNDSLRNKIRNLYMTYLPRLSPGSAFYPDLGDFFGRYYDTHFIPNTDSTLKMDYNFPSGVRSYPRYITLVGKPELLMIGYIPLNFTELKRDPEFKMILSRSTLFRNHKLVWYRRTERLMNELMTEIGNELKRLG